MNCDCTAAERYQYSENQDLTEEVERLEEERDALESEVRNLIRLVGRLFWGR